MDKLNIIFEIANKNPEFLNTYEANSIISQLNKYFYML